jgi:hypothetical protein
MSDTNPTRRADEPPTRDGAPLAGWPTAITAEEAVALREALGQLQTALDAVVRDRDEALAEVERLRAEMLELAEWCEAEEPLSHKKLSYRLRYAQEAKP